MGKYNKEKYYYFMLKSNFFDNDVLKYLQKQPNGYEMIILYFKLIFMSINKEGKLIKKIGKKNIPYTIEEISAETGHKETIIYKAIEYFLETNMIEKQKDILYIEDALTLTNQVSEGAMYMRGYRNKNPDKCKPKCKEKSNLNSKVYIDNRKNNNKLELIINNKKEIDNKYLKESNDIIAYLNFKTNSNFILIDEYKKLLNDLLKKHSYNDIKGVIDKKVMEWINDPKMKSFLTPETLFGIKFERYLHQKEKTRTIRDISMAEIQKAKEERNSQNGFN